MIEFTVDDYSSLSEERRADMEKWFLENDLNLLTLMAKEFTIPDSGALVVITRYTTDPADGRIMLHPETNRPLTHLETYPLHSPLPPWLNALHVSRYWDFHQPKEITLTMTTIEVRDTDLPFVARINPTDKTGELVEPDPLLVPTWEVSNPAVISIFVATDGRTATVTPLTTGTSEIVAVTTDRTARTPSGLAVKLVFRGTVIVSGGEGVEAEIDFTPPQDQVALAEPEPEPLVSSAATSEVSAGA